MPKVQISAAHVQRARTPGTDIHDNVNFFNGNLQQILQYTKKGKLNLSTGNIEQTYMYRKDKIENNFDTNQKYHLFTHIEKMNITMLSLITKSNNTHTLNMHAPLYILLK